MKTEVKIYNWKRCTVCWSSLKTLKNSSVNCKSQGNVMEKKYPDRNSYCCFNIIACNIHVEGFLSATHYTLSCCRHRFRDSAATRRPRHLTLCNPVWCHGSIHWYCIVWRWETQYEMILEERYHCSDVPTSPRSHSSWHGHKSRSIYNLGNI